MKFIETPIFTKYIYDYLDDDEYAALQWHLVQHPESGDLIPHSGGLRKVRWGAKNKGKRGGVRVIYYYFKSDKIWLLTLYVKNEQENISNRILNLLRQEIQT